MYKYIKHDEFCTETLNDVKNKPEKKQMPTNLLSIENKNKNKHKQAHILYNQSIILLIYKLNIQQTHYYQTTPPNGLSTEKNR